MLGLGCGPFALPIRRLGDTPAPAPAPAPARPDFTALGLAPAFAYHPDTDLVTLDGSNQLTSVTGQGGSPDLTPSSPGPLQITDAAGKKAWRFRGAGFLDLPTTFVTASTRAQAIFYVMRAHNATNNLTLFGHGLQADGVTDANTNGAFFRSFGAANTLAKLRATNAAATLDDQAMFAGASNMHLVGVAGRQTATGGTRFVIGGTSRNGAQPYYHATLAGNMQGGRIGGYRKGAGTNNKFDLYYAVCFNQELSDAQVDAVRDYLNAFFGLPTAWAKNLVFDADSIHAGFGNTSGESPPMYLCEPGRNLIPADVRVANFAVPGATVGVNGSENGGNNLVARRDVAGGWPSLLIAGGPSVNILLGNIGRNDVATADTAATIYGNILAYLNAASTGVTARGFSHFWSTPIATGYAPDQAKLETLRDYLRGTTGSGIVADAGSQGLVELALIEDAGAQRFNTGAQATNSAYYNEQSGIGTHPSALGARVIATGGTTPGNGWVGAL